MPSRFGQIGRRCRRGPCRELELGFPEDAVRKEVAVLASAKEYRCSGISPGELVVHVQEGSGRGRRAGPIAKNHIRSTLSVAANFNSQRASRLWRLPVELRALGSPRVRSHGWTAGGSHPTVDPEEPQEARPRPMDHAPAETPER